MKLYTLVLGVLDTNTYILQGKSGLIVIDPAADADKIINKAAELNEPIKYVLLTHGHFDHCNAVADLQKLGAKVFMSKADYDMIQNGDDLALYCGVTFHGFVPDEFIGEGEIELMGEKIKVLHTPGHTAGSLTYILDGNIFGGDVLFYMGIGRSDLPTGDGKALLSSVKKLFDLNGTVYPGHGRQTTIEFERNHSIYVKA